MISNAIKFSNVNGLIIIRLKQQFSLNANMKDYIQVSVSDNGIGIRKVDKKRLFKLYGSIKSKNSNQKGIGLGLVISKMIIEKFDGVINFVSKWRKGTSFFFTLEVEDYLPDEAKITNKRIESQGQIKSVS